MTESFHDKLSRALLNSKKSKVEIADAIGTSHVFIHHLIAGRNKPTLKRLEALKKTLSLSEDEYRDLLDALIREDSDFCAIAHHIEQHYFTYFYVPFLKSLLLSCPRIKSVDQRSSQILESTALWLGYVDTEIRRIGFPASPLRFFISKPNGEEIGLSWCRYDISRVELIPDVAPEIPSKAQYIFSFSSKIKDSCHQLDRELFGRQLVAIKPQEREQLKIRE